MRSRGLTFTLTACAAAVLALAAAAGGAQAPVRPVKVPSDAKVEKVVAYGRSRVLLLDPGFGERRGGITRMRLDGSIDRTFGKAGTVNISARDAAVAPDGKILVATEEGSGSHAEDARVVRLLPDGKLDRSFGRGGSAYISVGPRYAGAQTVALAPHGDVLVGGIRVDSSSRYGTAADLMVARLTPAGSLDHSFGRQGVTIVPVDDEIEAIEIAPTPSGGVVIEGGNEIEAFLAKLRRGGAVDRHFGHRGYAEIVGYESLPGAPAFTIGAPGLAVQPDGRLLAVVAGSRPGKPEGVVAVRLLADGRVDESYGRDGWAIDPGQGETNPQEVALLPNGDLAVATTFGYKRRDFGAIAFDRSGRLERHFAAHGICRARLPGDQEAADITVVAGRAVALSEPYGDGQWLVDCPPLR
jgi:uncharacterized delta-60 repeat protein